MGFIFSKEPEDVFIEDNHHLWVSSEGSDAVLRCCDETFYVHKKILTVHSEVFQALFQSLDDDKNIVDVSHIGIGPIPLRKMLCFMYSGKMPDSDSIHHILKLLEAAESYAVDPLKRKCLRIIQKGLKEDDICEILDFAHAKKDKMAALKDVVISYLVKNSSYLNSEKWRHFSEKRERLANEVLAACFRNSKR